MGPIFASREVVDRLEDCPYHHTPLVLLSWGLSNRDNPAVTEATQPNNEIGLQSKCSSPKSQDYEGS